MLDNSASCAIMCRFSSNELQLLLINHANTMAEQNVPTQPPTRTDEQIVPRSQWLTIGKSNLLFNAQKIQKNPIFQMLVDHLRKTSGSDKPRHLVLQMLWGIVTQTNVDHAELLWEEFTQGIQTFFSHKASHKASLKNPKKKVTPLLIPYGRGGEKKGDFDYCIRKFSKVCPKGESVEVLENAIPILITEAISNILVLSQVSGNGCEEYKGKTPQESASMQPATKRVIHQKAPNHHTKSVPQEEGDDPDLKIGQQMSLEAHQEKGEGERTSSQLKMTSSEESDPMNLLTFDSERTLKLKQKAAFLLKGDKDQGEVDSTTVTSGVSNPVSDPEKAHEALAGPDPEPMKEEEKTDHSGKFTYLIKKYSVLPGPESIQNQESEKSPKEIIRIKKEQGKEKKDSTLLPSVRNTAKLPSIPCALMEALIAVKNCLD
ncbi:hypothetical protein Tco_1031354 [Tanacetum coccineum]|uniref:Uncharacterized protein n=1 Tax=Tanacetum coccineum TaxID=301880 RepID=A0ABQ5GAG3_9ASTR